MEQQSRHESDSSSQADEKEIHNKLGQILNLIGDGETRNEDGEDIVRSEDEFSRRMADEVYDDVASEDLDLYQIDTNELEEDNLDLEAEMRKIAQ